MVTIHIAYVAYSHGRQRIRACHRRYVFTADVMDSAIDSSSGRITTSTRSEVRHSGTPSAHSSPTPPRITTIATASATIATTDSSTNRNAWLP